MESPATLGEAAQQPETMEESGLEKQQALQAASAPAMATAEATAEAMDEEDDDVTAECFTTEPAQQSVIKASLSRCVLCAKSFVAGDKSKLLECLHAACSGCIDSKLGEQQNTSVEADLIVENNTILCQLCNVISQPENLIENQFFTKFLEDDASINCEDERTSTEEDMKCLNCSLNSKATSWCVECELMICQECVKAHSGLKITQAHTIKPLGDISGDAENVKKKESSLYLFCTIHPHEQLSLFCQTCDRLTCRDCQLSEHRDHKYKFIHEIAVETRTSIKTLLTEVSRKRELLNTAMGVIKDRQRLISDKKKMLVEDITKMVVQLTHAISSRGKELIERLSEVCDQKQHTLNEKKVALDQLSKLTDHCLNFVNYALDKGTDMELLYNKKSATSQLQRIKNQRADIPNPDIPVRIHLNVDKVVDLIKVISSIGSIVVDGGVYPSVTPPSDYTPTTTPVAEPVEQKQINNSCAMNAVVDSLPVSQSISLLPTQTSNNLTHNAYISQPMNIPISSHQQLMQAQHMSNQQQMQNQAPSYLQHFNTHNMQQHAMPQIMPTYNANYNGRMTQQQQQQQHQQQHQQQQQQQQQMIMNQRPGIGNCHQQVTSSTHPHSQQQQQQQQLHIVAAGGVSDLHMNQNASLRGLLAHNPPAYRPTSNSVQYRFPPRYRYPVNNAPRNVGPTQNTYQAGTSLLTGIQIRQPSQPSVMLNVYQQQPQQLPPQTQSIQQSARWHIPQNLNAAPAYPMKNTTQQQQPVTAAPINDTYKITLKNQSVLTTALQSKNSNNAVSPPLGNKNLTVSQNIATISHTVSSSMPKTPSPAPHEKTDEPQKSLDKFCQKSLNDLMLTIAKLDSNGILVIPENQKSQLDSTQVDSSTDENVTAMTDNPSAASMTKDDPNEDWCAVCMGGGDAVLCCDKCPKVFHLYCHIPALKSFPHESETWQCMLCKNVLDCSEDPPEEQNHGRMSARDLRVAQRIVLELYCQYEQSLPFREVVSPEIVEYHRIIKKPIALDNIRDKLNQENENHYTDLKQVLADIRLLFKNAFTFNHVDSQVYQGAKSLEDFFEKLLIKWIPNYAYDNSFITEEGVEDEEVFPPNRKYRRIIND